MVRRCTRGKPCGNSCINKNYNCGSGSRRESGGRTCNRGKPCGRSCINKAFTCKSDEAPSEAPCDAPEVPAPQEPEPEPEYGWSCTAPYSRSNASTGQRIRSCRREQGGTYANRQTCIENCNVP